jgi:L-ascorbate metabolism protein UlaG (beta-lactamase superfamily)
MTVALTWLGQSGFILADDGVIVAVDPFLSPHELRLHDPPALDTLPHRVDAVLATHGHADHLDLAGLAAWVESGAALAALVVPTPHVAAARRSLPDVDVVGVQPGEQLDVGTASVTVVPACHGVEITDGYSEGYALDPAGTPHVGYVISIAGTTVYHAGDTIASAEIRRALAPLVVDVALLPVNGRDAQREAQGILGNLTAVEAVDLADEIGVDRLVPCHHDMIRGNTAAMTDIARAARRAGTRVRLVTPERGVAVALGQRGRR